MLASAKGTCTNASYNHTRKPTHSLCGQYKCHCVKSVRIRGFFGPNKGKYRPKNSKYGQFLLSVYTHLEKNSKESLLHSTECKMRIFSVHIKTNRITQVLTQE